MSIGTEMQNTPFPDLVKTLGKGIAEAQFELDLVSLQIARLMAGYGPETDNGSSAASSERTMLVKLGDGNEYSLLELGFVPTFYQFVDTLIELKLSISMVRETNEERSSTDVNASVSGSVSVLKRSASAKMSVSTVSASYSSKYQYSAEGSSLMRTKLVPVPAPAILEERIRAMIDPIEES